MTVIWGLSLRPQIFEVPFRFFPLLRAYVPGSVFGLTSGFSECQKKVDFHNQYNLLCKMVHMWI